MSIDVKQLSSQLVLYLSKNRQKIIKTMKFVALAFVALLLLFFVFRNSLLNYFLNKQVANFSEKYDINIEVQEASFSGFKSVSVSNISIAKNNESEKLLHIGLVNATVNLLDLIKANIRFSSLTIDTLNIVLYKDYERDNFSFLLKNKEAKKEKQRSSIDYAETLNSLLNLAFEAIPSNFSITQAHLKLNYDSLNLNVFTPGFAIQNQNFNSQFTLIENSDTSLWHIEGNIDNSLKNVQLKYYSNQKGIVFPLLKQQLDLTLSCDTMYYSLTNFEFNNGQLHLSGVAQLSNFEINHWRISSKNVIINKSQINYQLTIGSNYVQLDSVSSIELNKIKLNPFVKLELNHSKKLTLKINTPLINASDFFESLPTGLFTNLEGLQTKGQLDYRLDFEFDTKLPDSVIFNSKLSAHEFKILDFGASNLNKMNEEFSYTVYEKDNAVRTFLVGPSNPFYTSMDKISPYLQYSILSSEDGNFYNHKGFNEKRFAQSIAENFKQKRFVRGASTISMQLVKNVFLRRNKTIARKLEEAIIVWLIENNRVVSKQRMYEVYLNIIEFGPNVFGIGEAANFYFQKTPAQLAVEESIFLAMIVPRPKWFMYQFDNNGKLNENTYAYFSLIAGHLVSKGVITEEQKTNLHPDIKLAFPASSFLLKKDTLNLLPKEDLSN